ncbi:hypothetical protein [uncultured Litoreibacter sp.]|uniref:hypothetical protein n=2 Tax=uncultured Litoreibacter sp. TaxID=1392394 RepID=UPI00262BA85F|nr:hypothetical protein [uncultured Litoreibacter sp.]
MTPPCNIDPQLVGSQDGPFFRLDYYASPEGCSFDEGGSNWTSESVAQVHITNTSDSPFSVFVRDRGSLRGASIVEKDFPDRSTIWRSGPPRKVENKQVETVLQPRAVWKSNTARIIHPTAAISVMKGLRIGRPKLPVIQVEPREFIVTTRFIANLVQNNTQQRLDRQFSSTLMISYVPEEDYEDPIRK